MKLHYFEKIGTLKNTYEHFFSLGGGGEVGEMDGFFVLLLDDRYSLYQTYSFTQVGIISQFFLYGWIVCFTIDISIFVDKLVTLCSLDAHVNDMYLLLANINHSYYGVYIHKQIINTLYILFAKNNIFST